MSTARTWSAAGGDSGPFDVVGERVLVGIQVVDISRLSTHPVPMVSQGLVTVAGQGPKDSNGAGKSSLIAAVSLLHADEQWRLASGAAGAAELLFTAELAAQEGRWSNVDWGYVIGVFADPRAGTTDELSASALTVWLRINRKASHVHLRWKDGLYVPYGATESERAAGVDTLWDRLPTSNGRTDFHANRLASVLYGSHVRCVSFLSTSVRSSPAANLLAQPLNDLAPRRIFDAIATLTGLDRELEQEQALRSTEYTHRTDVLNADGDLKSWEHEMAVVEAGIALRGEARHLLDDANASWRARCARRFLDAVARIDEIRLDLSALEHHTTGLKAQLSTVEDDLSGLTDDEEFDRNFREVEGRWNTLSARDQHLDTQHQIAAKELEGLGVKHRDLSAKSRAADGRNVETAQAEEADAHAAVERALGSRGVAEEAENQASRRLAAAESGEDVAADELQALREAGIPAATLLDVVQLDPDQRHIWEPRLVPYRDAVVIPRGHAGQAQEKLAGRPGSATLVVADPPRTHAPTQSTSLPASADMRFDLTTFLTTILERTGAQPAEVDVAAGVIVVAEFAEPLTGRAARIAAARAEHRAKAGLLTEANQLLAAARRKLSRAKTRTEAAMAGDEANATELKMSELRGANEVREEQREKLKPLLDAARVAYTDALGAGKAREEQIKNLNGAKSRLEGELTAQDKTKTKLTDERSALDLPGREAAWGDSPGGAHRFLLALPAEQQSRTTAAWNDETCYQVNEVVRRCFPEGTPHDEMPAEIRELLIEQRWQRGGLDTRAGLVPALIRALRTHLSQTEQHDLYQQQQIATQRAQRTGDLAKARKGLSEAEQTSRAHRASLALGIKARLKKVSEEFDRLDQRYGGYGASLDYPEPEPPAEPDRPWRWTVTPKWRRAEGQRMSGYNLRSNTAQMDEKAVKLVCAAALAGGGSRPLLLVLDELGRNLGKQHRREAVALFEQIGKDRNITVIGALQDDMERYAIEASGLYIKLRRRSDSMAYNEAPVIVGDETNRARVELLREWLASYRPVTDIADDECGKDHSGDGVA
ncbi:putative nucleic acid-binding Zn-ribbon protein [Amycolatopsis sulphurea]|uniref:Putative nucleic acid-binding Zn-ribbon protein n=1 Tax=Amycolatopsis sulphurea TaxID=76022 RepID=A0A2A9FHU2_9PSEU|nr:chromosome segregation ATPase [Amycolatopsis sulphurea]PFG49999.1 putative nucleic acid-binding Zn-ribbon protein [Amycolatopsis sulphurea]